MDRTVAGGLRPSIFGITTNGSCVPGLFPLADEAAPVVAMTASVLLAIAVGGGLMVTNARSPSAGRATDWVSVSV